MKRKPISEMTVDERNGFWPTVKEAIPPLVRHLLNDRDMEYEGLNYIEPCAGAGDLINLLEDWGCNCLDACDINPKGANIFRMDALDFVERIKNEGGENYSFIDLDCIITNPPFSRHHNPLLCEMIRRFSAILPTWLLLPAGFKYNDYAEEFMPYCEKVIGIGRLKWVKGTKDKSIKDFDWYLFDQNFTGQTQFFYNNRGGK